MGVPICTCDSQTGNLVKESSVECFGKNIELNNENRIIIKGNHIVHKKNSNYENSDDKDIEKLKYKKEFLPIGKPNTNFNITTQSKHEGIPKNNNLFPYFLFSLNR